MRRSPAAAFARPANRPQRARARGERGQILAVGAGMLLLCLLVAGLVVDYGAASSSHSHAQGVADNAAMSIAYLEETGNSQQEAEQTVAKMVQAQGVDASSVTLTYNDGNGHTGTCPLGSALPSDTCGSYSHWVLLNTVTAALTFRSGNIFMSLVGVTSSQVSDTAVAKVGPPITYTPCILCLTGNSGTDIAMNNPNSTLSVTGGAILVDSPSSTSIGSAGAVTATGGVYYNGTGTAPACGCSPAPRPAPPVTDPFTYAAPSLTGSAVAATGCSGTISPGIYSTITTSNNATCTLQPGVYVIEGGGIQLSNNSTLTSTNSPPSPVTGTGVLLYFTCNGYPTPCPAPTGNQSLANETCGSGNNGSPGGGLDASNNAFVTTLAPTTGAYKGLGIFFDPNNYNPICFSENSGGSATFGAIDAPASALDLLNNAGGSYGAVAVGQLSIGNLTVNVNLGASPGAMPTSTKPGGVPVLTQ